MLRRTHDDLLALAEALADDDGLVVRRADLDLPLRPARGLVIQQTVVLAAMLDNGLHGNLKHVGNGLHTNLDLGGHAGAELNLLAGRIRFFEHRAPSACLPVRLLIGIVLSRLAGGSGWIARPFGSGVRHRGFGGGCAVSRLGRTFRLSSIRCSRLLRFCLRTRQFRRGLAVPTRPSPVRGRALLLLLLAGQVDSNRGFVFLHIAGEERGRDRVFIDFCHFALQFQIGESIEANSCRHSRLDHRNAGLVDIGFDLHSVGVGKPEDDLAFPDGSAFFDDDLTPAAPVCDIGVNHLAVIGSHDRAFRNLLLDILEFLQIEPVTVLFRLQLGLGRLDIGVELLERLDLLVFLEHVQLGLRLFELLLGVLHGKRVGFDRQVGHVSSRKQFLRVVELLPGLPQPLFRHKDIAFDSQLLFRIRSLEILFLGNHGRLVVVTGLDDCRLAGVADDLLLDEVLFQ